VTLSSSLRGGLRAAGRSSLSRLTLQNRKAEEERRRGLARLVGFLLVGLGVGALLFGVTFAGGAYLLRQGATDLVGPGVSVLLLGVFGALVLSCLGHAANAFFTARDLWFWNAAPAPAWSRFFDRSVETALAALPATVLLGALALAGLLLGAGHGLVSLARGLAALALVSLMPLALGVLLAHLGGAILPAGRLRRVMLLVVGLAAAVGLALLRSARLERIVTEQGAAEFLEQQRDVVTVGSEWLPNNLGASFTVHGALVPFALLFVCAASLQLGAYLAHRLLYVRARDLADDESPTGLVRGSLSEAALKATTALVRPKLRPLLEKDLLAFVRDPSQWSQLVLLLGIAVIYLINAKAFVMGFEPFPLARSVFLGGMHVGLATFIAAGLAARFAFPQLGLEGPAVWLLEASPLSPQSVIKAKLFSSLPVVAGFPTLVAAAGGVVVGLSPTLWLLTTLEVAGLSVCLAALGVGRGSVAPLFDAISVSELSMGPGALSTMMSAVALCGVASFSTMLAGGALAFRGGAGGTAMALAFTVAPIALATLAGRSALRQGAAAFAQRRVEGTAGSALPAASSS
jgi:ABC-2 type transport system permease protein